jgi:hypothetical protein
MTTIWDDPELQIGGDFVKFEAPGDSITGDIVAVSKHTFPDGKIAAKLVIRDENGEDKTLTAGQVKLAELLNEKRPMPGDRIRIVHTEVEKRPGGKTMKHFTVDVKPGDGTVPAPKEEVVEEPF